MFEFISIGKYGLFIQISSAFGIIIYNYQGILKDKNSKYHFLLIIYSVWKHFLFKF